MRAKEWICRGLVMFLIPLLAAPCVASGEAKANLLSATPLDSGSVNHIELGEAVCILVSENQTTPYRWEYVISDETAMQGLCDEYTSDPNPLGMDGVGGKHRFYFIATSTGACSINMRLLRIGADKEDASQEVTYTVMIEEPAAEEGDKELADPDVKGAGVPLFEHLANPVLTAFAMNFETDFPVSVSVRHDGEAGGTPVTLTDPETVRAVFVALRQITVLGQWPASGHTDDYLNYYFEMADGRVIYGFEFQDGMLLDEGLGLYEITGFDALQRALPDPGEL